MHLGGGGCTSAGFVGAGSGVELLNADELLSTAVASVPAAQTVGISVRAGPFQSSGGRRSISARESMFFTAVKPTERVGLTRRIQLVDVVFGNSGQTYVELER